MSEKQRERFSSRLGFILVSAGCAIGIGNVWKFPYLCGQFGGASFILIYLFFLLVLGIPVLVTELAIGRKSQRSAARAFNVLEQKGTYWHQLKYITIVGCYLLMILLWFSAQEQYHLAYIYLVSKIYILFSRNYWSVRPKIRIKSKRSIRIIIHGIINTKLRNK